MLRELLVEVNLSNAMQGDGRCGALRAALVGYPNAAEAGLLGPPTSSSPDLARLDLRAPRVGVGNGVYVLVADTVDLIVEQPQRVVASFRATLEKVTQANVLFDLVDAADPAWE